MTLKRLPQSFSVCKLKKMPVGVSEIFFFAKTDEELSLVCRTEDVRKRENARNGYLGGYRYGRRRRREPDDSPAG